MSSEPLTFHIPLNRQSVVYSDGYGSGHILDDPNWSPAALNYVERAALAARLRAIAEVVEPGTFDNHLERMRERLGAESVGRT